MSSNTGLSSPAPVLYVEFTLILGPRGRVDVVLLDTVLPRLKSSKLTLLILLNDGTYVESRSSSESAGVGGSGSYVDFVKSV